MITFLSRGFVHTAPHFRQLYLIRSKAARFSATLATRHHSPVILVCVCVLGVCICCFVGQQCRHLWEMLEVGSECLVTHADLQPLCLFVAHERPKIHTHTNTHWPQEAVCNSIIVLSVVIKKNMRSNQLSTLVHWCLIFSPMNMA